MRGRGVSVVGVVGCLLVLLLAGCTADGPKANGSVKLGDGTTIELAQPDNTITAGSISGVVVDEAIRPLAGVNLTLGGENVTVPTDVNGLFVFTDLEPGLYTLQANGGIFGGKRFLPIQTTAEVVAGETAKVRIVLPVDPNPVGYHATLGFNGFYTVSSGFVDEILDLYVFNQTYGPVTTPPGPQCACRWDVFADAEVSTFVAELVWEEPSPGNPAPEFWTLDLNSENGTAPLYFCEDGSPCNAHIQQAGNFSSSDRTFSIGVWTDPSWVYVNQKFQLFVTLFYIEEAPSSWSFVGGDV